MSLDDPKKVKESRIRAREKQARLDEFTKFIMSSPQGRNWMWDWLETFQIFQTPFSSDPIIMAHNTGMKEPGLKLMDSLMALTPTEFMTMLKEAADARHAQSLLDAQSDSDGADDPGYAVSPE